MGLPKVTVKSFVAILKHFIRKIQHSNVKLDTQCLANICQVVKEIRIPAPKMHGYYITFLLVCSLLQMSFSIPGRESLHSDGASTVRQET